MSYSNENVDQGEPGALKSGTVIDAENVAAEIEVIRRRAESGSRESQAALSTMLLIGKHVERDRDEGLKWLRKAAQQGHRHAQLRLGTAYRQHCVLPEEPGRALNALRSAVEEDDGAKHVLDEYESRGVPMASEAYKTPDEWHELAAAHWLERAARQGMAEAQYEIAHMYRQGKGVAVDYMLSYMWANIAGIVVDEARSICFDLKHHRYASFDQIAEAQRLTREFVPIPEKPESDD